MLKGLWAVTSDTRAAETNSQALVHEISLEQICLLAEPSIYSLSSALPSTSELEVLEFVSDSRTFSSCCPTPRHSNSDEILLLIPTYTSMSFTADGSEKQRNKAYIVICKLAHIVVVHTEILRFRRRSHTTVRNEVHNPQDNSLSKHFRTEQ